MRQMSQITFVLLLIATSTFSFIPIKDDCRSNLMNERNHSLTRPFHNHYFSISPSGKWALESIHFFKDSTEYFWCDSIQLYVFRYCYPTEHIYLTTFYARLSAGMLLILSPDGDCDHNFVAMSPPWGGQEDTVYFIVNNSTMNSKESHSEIFKMDISSITITGRTQSNHPNISPKLLKTANYPNPFQRMITFEYSIPIEGYVAINVYNATGELIRVLGQEKQKSGMHSIIWNGKDNLGNQVSDGVYYYQIISGDYISAKTVTKIK
jgi:hypothetical protein